MSRVPVTIVIPTLDGGERFRRLLRALTRAEPGPERVVVIDSDSRDGSDRAAEEAGADLIRIRREEFDHGATRQRGVEDAATELVAFLSQDTEPEPGYLGPLCREFQDAQVAGATARILPFPDSSPLARRTVLASPMASDTRQVFSAEDRAAFSSLTAEARRRICHFDNVASVARRRVLLELPFPRTMMGEDAAFAARAIEAGYRLVHVPDAVVRHAHEYGPLGAFRRYRDDARWVHRQFGIQIRRSLWHVFRGVAFEIREDYRALRSAGGDGRAVPWSEWVRSPLLRSGQVAGQWWGTKGRAAS